MGQRVVAQGRPKVANICKSCPHCDVTSRAPHRNRKIVVFDFDYKTCWIRRGFQQVSSSIAWRVIGLQISARKVAHVGRKGLVWCEPAYYVREQYTSPHLASCIEFQKNLSQKKIKMQTYGKFSKNLDDPDPAWAKLISNPAPDPKNY